MMILRGYIGSVDLDAAELVVAAILSGDEKMARDLMTGDPHTKNAARSKKISEDEVTKDMRDNVKTITYKGLYGGWPVNEEQRIVKNYLDKEYPDLRKWLDQSAKEARKKLKVQDIWGKNCSLEDLYDPSNEWRSLGSVERTGLNFKIQGPTSQVSMTIMNRAWELFRKYKLNSLVLMGIHDSTMFDIHPLEVDPVSELVQRAFLALNDTPLAKFRLFNNPIPISGKLLIGRSWGDLKEPKKPTDKNTLSFPPVPCSSKGV